MHFNFEFEIFFTNGFKLDDTWISMSKKIKRKIHWTHVLNSISKAQNDFVHQTKDEIDQLESTVWRWNYFGFILMMPNSDHRLKETN